VGTGSGITLDERALRAAIVDACRSLSASDLTQGTSGNVSARRGKHMLITPSGVPCDRLTPETIAAMPLDGEAGAWEGPLRPSTEWRFHLDILRSRPEVGAVVHAHPPYATALAIARRNIPAAHYMVAAFGGGDVRCSEYATFGSQALSRAALAALEGRQACLLANHGTIALGADLDRAMWLAVELETLARQYVLSLSVGGPVLLTMAEVEEARRAFAGYGPRETPELG
jgi:L-fuculose-phosphate aldolase